MAYSRVSRIEERRTRTRLILVCLGIFAVLTLLISVGIPLLVGASVWIGNLKSKQPLAETTDKTPPFPPILSTGNTATNSATLKIDGYGEPDSTLKLFLNDSQVKEALLGKDGAFSFSDIQLTKGANSFYATLTDSAGNVSSPSAKINVNYKKDLPKLEVSEPTDNQTFGKNQQDILVRGSTDPGNDVRINDRFVLVKDDGSFTFNLKLNEGDTTLSIVATDPAGNQTKLERKVTYAP